MNDQTRREFLKRCVRLAGGGVAGLAAIHGLGLGAVEDARAWGILPAVIGSGGAGGASTSWADWDEITEAGWGNTNTNICLFENTSAAGNETSKGVLTDADLTFTQISNVAGAVGSPPYRAIGGSQGFTATATYSNTMMTAAAGWICIIKFTYSSGAAGAQIIQAGDGGNNRFFIEVIGGTVKTYMKTGGTTLDWGSALTDTMSGGTTYYLVMWGTTSFFRIGFSTTKPTKWSNFAANKRASYAGNALYGSGSMTNVQCLGYDGGGTSVQGNYYYFLASKTPSVFINDSA